MTAPTRPGPAAGADVTRLRAALAAPGGASAPGLAWLTGRTEAWTYRQLDDGTDAGDVDRIGPDPIARAGRYRATQPRPSVPALLAAALTVLSDRGLCQGDYVNGAGAVDLSGALRIAAGVHPRELPDDLMTQLAVFEAEDELALALGHDPARVDAGEVLAVWNDRPSRTLTDATGLLERALAATGLPARTGDQP